jgi:hypothetical protein
MLEMRVLRIVSVHKLVAKLMIIPYISKTTGLSQNVNITDRLNILSTLLCYKHVLGKFIFRQPK